MWPRRLAVLVTLAVIVTVLRASYEPLFERHASRQRHYQSTKESKNIPSSEAADDRIATYTLWLAIFTAALVGVSAVQIRYLIQADETARRSADAAKGAAEAAVTQAEALQRLHTATEAQETHLRAQNIVLSNTASAAQQQAAAALSAAIAARDNANISRQVLQQSNRAWLRPDIWPGPMSCLSFDEAGLLINACLKIRNVGNAPALNVQFGIWLFS